MDIDASFVAIQRASYSCDLSSLCIIKNFLRLEKTSCILYSNGYVFDIGMKYVIIYKTSHLFDPSFLYMLKVNVLPTLKRYCVTWDELAPFILLGSYKGISSFYQFMATRCYCNICW